MAKKMNHDVSKAYDPKKGGSSWRSKMQKGTESLNIPKRDKGAKINNIIGEGKNEENNS